MASQVNAQDQKLNSLWKKFGPIDEKVLAALIKKRKKSAASKREPSLLNTIRKEQDLARPPRRRGQKLKFVNKRHAPTRPGKKLEFEQMVAYVEKQMKDVPLSQCGCVGNDVIIVLLAMEKGCRSNDDIVKEISLKPTIELRRMVGRRLSDIFKKLGPLGIVTREKNESGFYIYLIATDWADRSVLKIYYQYNPEISSRAKVRAKGRKRQNS